VNLKQWLMMASRDEKFTSNVTYWHTVPAREARYGQFPEHLDARLLAAYARRGIHHPYSHQEQAIRSALAGKDICVVTPTASGKTLCYNLPVLQSILDDPNARALYLFPTKALSADQVSELYEIIEEAELEVKTYTYDGDTPPAARKAVRQAGHIVVTNPDMLHGGILPNHTKWIRLFENLKYVVIDEIHSYRGVFGSHLCNVLRRLSRICEFYGSHPQFICCSATIANPGELAGRIIQREVTLIDDNGAPAGEKHFIFYNPPVINRQLGIRKSAMSEAISLAERLLGNSISTIVFSKSRVQLEVMVHRLREHAAKTLHNANLVRGYRGGYLPTERRAIEKGLRQGEILGVVSTNALELGIDIGSLEACIICGYPGTIASTWQESGRAGRRSGASLTILVSSSSPMSQFIIGHPEYFFHRSPEYGLIHPENLYILLDHLKCAAYELPFRDGETFGGVEIRELLDFLQDSHILRHVGTTWHWSAEDFPAVGVSLRSASNENFTIVDITKPEVRLLGIMDRFAAPMLLHEQAIYMHEGRQYQVEKLDFDDRKAYVRHVDVDYYTDANLDVNLRVLDVFEKDGDTTEKSWGEVLITSLVSIFKKMKMDTGENVGFGPVNLPEMDMHTTAYWACADDSTLGDLSQEEIQTGMMGVANLLGVVAPAYLMCDVKDIAVVHQVKSPFTLKPTVFIYDAYPGGIGFSEKLFHLHDDLLREARELLTSCRCLNGCPSCVGPDSDKQLTLRLLDALSHDTQSQSQA